jgi:1-acyl-sn-glycerol-3-phosphate acyltransferase
MGEGFYKASHAVLGPILRTLWRIDTRDEEHVPDQGPAILASNHLSYLDHFLMPAVVDRPVYFISKAEHFDVPVQSWLFEQWGVIPLERGEGDDEALEQAAAVLEDGDLFGIYPEGTRSIDGRLHKGHTGVARLALRVGVPIVPVGMVGTYEALPKGESLPRFPEVEVLFGEPMTFEDLHGRHEEYDVVRKVTDQVMHAIQGLTGQTYVDEYQWNPEYVPEGRLDPDEEGS